MSPEAREKWILYKYGWFLSQNRQSCSIMPWACNSLLPEEGMDSIWIPMLATSTMISCQPSLPRWGEYYFMLSPLSTLLDGLCHPLCSALKSSTKSLFSNYLQLSVTLWLAVNLQYSVQSLQSQQQVTVQFRCLAEIHSFCLNKASVYRGCIQHDQHSFHGMTGKIARSVALKVCDITTLEQVRPLVSSSQVTAVLFSVHKTILAEIDILRPVDPRSSFLQ